MFFDMWKYIYSKSLFITLYTEKIFFEQNKQNKLLSFFYHELQLITVLLLIRYSYTSWSTWFITLKLCVGFSIFNSVSFLLKFTLSFSFKKKSLFDFKCHMITFKIKKWQENHTQFCSQTSDFYIAIRNFSDICVS